MGRRLLLLLQPPEPGRRPRPRHPDQLQAKTKTTNAGDRDDQQAGEDGRIGDHDGAVDQQLRMVVKVVVVRVPSLTQYGCKSRGRVRARCYR